MSLETDLPPFSKTVIDLEILQRQQLLPSHDDDVQKELEKDTSNGSSASKSDLEDNHSKAPIDSKSFAQKLFSTTSWRLASFIEVYGGKYRMIHRWIDDGLIPVVQALAQYQSTDQGHAQIVETDTPYAFVHKRIGVFRYPVSASIDNDRGRPLSLSPFGHIIYGLARNRMQKQPLQKLGRTCPFGTASFFDLDDIATKHEVMLRLVSDILSSPSELRDYAQDPRIPSSAATKTSQTIPLTFLVQEFLALLDFEQHPPTVLTSICRSVRATYADSPPTASISDAQAAHIINIAVSVLVAVVIKSQQEHKAEGWQEFVNSRKKGHLLSIVPSNMTVRKAAVDYMATYQDELAVNLTVMILRSLASRNYRYGTVQKDTNKSGNDTHHFHSLRPEFWARIVYFLKPEPRHPPSRRVFHSKILLEWARTVLLRDWDGQAKFSWSSDFGCALDFMRLLCKLRRPACACMSLTSPDAFRSRIGLQANDFYTNVLFDKMDFVEVANGWMTFTPSNRTAHLLSFPWLFPPSAIVTLFRAINFSTMFRSFEKSTMMDNLVRRMASYVHGSQRKLLERLHVPTTSFLVLEIRRDNLLRDALNQLWRRQKRELFRPLKVRMGMDEGEEGFDLGGVQQEFFRLAIAEALDPIHGLFTVDETTRMTWFLPCSSAPLHQYVLIGLLLGLAVYNGLTIPVTFPIALYRKILDLPVESLPHVADGWPSLAKGLLQMLQFEGSVEDIFVRQYVFSFESQGVTHEINMLEHNREDPWPPSSAEEQDADGRLSSSPWEVLDASSTKTQSGAPSEGSGEAASSEGQEAGMVTNENRNRYVADYIYWLTDKSVAPQYSAFATGFYLPLQKKSLQLFTPENLRSLVEGIQEIDIDGLQRTAQYEDGYNVNHPTVVDFWKIVRGFSLEERQQLLEFVTASDRVPVRGVAEMTFIVQRNGVGDEVCIEPRRCYATC